MRLLLTGVTGVAGLAIYRAALDDPGVSAVTVLTRRPLPAWAVLPANASAKTEVVLHSDFLAYPPELARRLAAHDAIIWAMGRSASGMPEAEYTALTHDYPLAAARALKFGGAGAARDPDAPFRFVYISGEMADPTEKSRMMWARVKGRAEKDLAEFCNASEGMKAHSYRPGYFFPSKDYPADRQHQRSATERAADVAMRGLFTLWPSGLSPIDDLARFAVAVAKGRWPDKEMFRNADMRDLVKEVQ